MELIQAGGKGKVAIYGRDGLHWLRWSYQWRRYSLAVGHGQIKPTKAIAAKIESDMAAGHFDTSLEDYRPKSAKPDEKSAKCLATFELWRMFTDSKRSQVSGQRIAAVYQPMAANLERYGRDVTDHDSAVGLIDLLPSRQSTTIANQNLALEHLYLFELAEIPIARMTIL